MLALTTLLVAQAPCLPRAITPASPPTLPAFGLIFDVDGDRMMVGNQFYSPGPTLPGEELLVLERDPSTGDWSEVDAIPFGAGHGLMSRALRIDLEGDTAILLDEAGVVHEITRDPSTGAWSQVGILATTTVGTLRGGLAFSGDIALVGDPNANPSTVSVLERSGGTWSTHTTFSMPAADSFGADIAYDGRFAVVGAPDTDGGRGQIHFYTRLPSGAFVSAGTGGRFGSRLKDVGLNVALVGDVAVTSAPLNTLSGQDANVGRLFVYTYLPVQGTWVRTQTISPSGAGTANFLGHQLAAGDGYVAAAAVETASVGAPAVYLYRLDPFVNLFRFDRRILGGTGASAPFDGGGFGQSLEVANSLVFVGMAAPAQLGVTPLARTDCDGDSAFDSCEILLGQEFDTNGNSFPDPCEETGVRYCSPATPNSAGTPGRLAFFGPPRTALLYINLFAEGLPPGALTSIMVSRDNGVSTNPGQWNGNLCLGTGAIYGGLGGMREADRNGRVGVLVNRPLLPDGMGGVIRILPGETWYYQMWYRDLGTTPNGSYTDAIGVTFTLF